MLGFQLSPGMGITSIDVTASQVMANNSHCEMKMQLEIVKHVLVSCYSIVYSKGSNTYTQTLSRQVLL